MKDDNLLFIKGKTKEEMIINLKNIVTLLSQKLEMDLRYIDVEDIINKRDKEQVKYLLVLFINILKIKELKEQHLINVHFNNQIEQLQRHCLTEIEKGDKTESNLNKSLDFIFKKKKNNENAFLELLKNIKEKYKLNTSKDSEPKIMTLPASKEVEKKQEKKIISIDKNNHKYFLSKNVLIDFIIKLIKETLPANKFYEFLINDSFNKKISNIIKSIYILHSGIFKNSLISKQFLIDYNIDIKNIIQKELYIYYERREYKKVINNPCNIKIFSKKLKNIKTLRKFYILNYKKEKNELKVRKLENEYQRKKSYIAINKIYKIYPELIRIKKNKEMENLEFQELLFKLKYYQKLKKKESIINIMRKGNNKAKTINKYVKKN